MYHNEKKPLVLLFPWLGAPKDSISKYVNIYNAAGCDVIIKTASVIDFLWPNCGINNCKKFLEENKIASLSVDRLVIIHSMSVGCYFYSILLHLMQTNKSYYFDLLQNIKGQVFDSPVIGSLNEMATGVSTTTTNNKIAGLILKNLTLTYFCLSRPFTITIYDKLINITKHELPCVPSLLMSSIGDPLSSLNAFNNLVNCWKDRNIPFVSKMWNKSVHAQHLKYHPILYQSLVNNFIKAAKQAYFFSIMFSKL